MGGDFPFLAVTLPTYRSAGEPRDLLQVAFKEKARDIGETGPNVRTTLIFICSGNFPNSKTDFPENKSDLIGGSPTFERRGVVTPEQALQWKAVVMKYTKRYPGVAGDGPQNSQIRSRMDIFLQNVTTRTQATNHNSLINETRFSVLSVVTLHTKTPINKQ